MSAAVPLLCLLDGLLLKHELLLHLSHVSITLNLHMTEGEAKYRDFLAHANKDQGPIPLLITDTHGWSRTWLLRLWKNQVSWFMDRQMRTDRWGWKQHACHNLVAQENAAKFEQPEDHLCALFAGFKMVSTMTVTDWTWIVVRSCKKRKIICPPFLRSSQGASTMVFLGNQTWR